MSDKHPHCLLCAVPCEQCPNQPKIDVSEEAVERLLDQGAPFNRWEGTLRELRRQLSEKEAEVKSAMACCDSYAAENQRISDERDRAVLAGVKAAIEKGIAAIDAEDTKTSTEDDYMLTADDCCEVLRELNPEAIATKVKL